MTGSQATCDLLYQLGISANYKGFFHAAYAVAVDEAQNVTRVVYSITVK